MSALAHFRRPFVLFAVPLALGCPHKDEDDDTSEPPSCFPETVFLADANAVLSGGGSADHVGDALAPGGDMNGDGVVDLLLAATAAQPNGQFSGMAQVVYGPILGSVNLSTADASIMGGDEFDYLGSTLVSPGDFNKDGYSDIIVGASGADAQATDGGAVYMFVGPLSGELAASSADVIFVGTEEQAGVGTAVGAGGDLNGDGFPDMAIGAPGIDRVYIYRGPFPPETYDFTDAEAFTYPEQDGDEVGSGLSLSTDMDGDGVAELLISAPEFYRSGYRVGKIYAITDALAYEDGEIWLELENGAVEGVSNTQRPGTDLAGLGDINGDGYGDLLIGGEYSETETSATSGSSEGMAVVVYGPLRTTRAVTETDAQLYGTEPGERAGSRVDAAGDVDGDGNMDLLIGAPGRTAGGANSGGAYLVYGPVGGSMSLDQADVTVEGSSRAYAGTDVAGLGDMNGDGFADFVVGAPGDRSSAGTGQISLFLGCSR